MAKISGAQASTGKEKCHGYCTFPVNNKKLGLIIKGEAGLYNKDLAGFSMSTSGRGFRTGTRRKLKKGLRSKFTVEKFLRKFEKNESVLIAIDPSSQNGMPHIRYKGLVGKVKGTRGESYIVGVRSGNKPVELIVRPEHLRHVSK